MKALNVFLGIVLASTVLYIIFNSRNSNQVIQSLAGGTSSIITSLQGRGGVSGPVSGAY